MMSATPREIGVRKWAPNHAAVTLGSAAAAVLAAFTAGCVQSGDAGTPIAQSPAQQGRALAQRECAHCHSIRELGDSPRADAPPLREVLNSYNPSRLELSFREGLIVGHADMPLFEFSQAEVDALLAYLQDIRS
jgi:mono/diheme cytochrome c family protein